MLPHPVIEMWDKVYAFMQDFYRKAGVEPPAELIQCQMAGFTEETALTRDLKTTPELIRESISNNNLDGFSVAFGFERSINDRLWISLLGKTAT